MYMARARKKTVMPITMFFIMKRKTGIGDQGFGD